MYLVNLKRTLVGALAAAFGPDYPIADMAGMRVGLEYSDAKSSYPQIVVSYEPVGNLMRSGIDQPFFAAPGAGYVTPLSIWRAQGYAVFTIGALSAPQRDAIYDELIGMVAFSAQSPYTRLRGLLESSPFIALNLNADTISQRGMGIHPPPWDGPEWVYEATIAVEVVIEFAPSLVAPPAPEIEGITIVASETSSDGVDTDSETIQVPGSG